MNEQTLKKLIPWVAALFVATASEFFPIAGMLASALIFPQGIHSGHATAYLVLAMMLNFAIFYVATLWLLRFLLRRM